MSNQTDTDTNGTERGRPLNVTDEEIAFLWGLMKREVGKEEVQHGPDRDTAEAIHTKVRRLYYADGGTNEGKSTKT